MFRHAQGTTRRVADLVRPDLRLFWQRGAAWPRILRTPGVSPLCCTHDPLALRRREGDLLLRRRRSANRYDIDAEDVLRRSLHSRLDTAHQRLGLHAVETPIDVDPGHNPDSAWTEEGEEEFANTGDTGIPEEKGS